MRFNLEVIPSVQFTPIGSLMGPTGMNTASYMHICFFTCKQNILFPFGRDRGSLREQGFKTCFLNDYTCDFDRRYNILMKKDLKLRRSNITGYDLEEIPDITIEGIQQAMQPVYEHNLVSDVQKISFDYDIFQSVAIHSRSQDTFVCGSLGNKKLFLYVFSEAHDGSNVPYVYSEFIKDQTYYDNVIYGHYYRINLNYLLEYSLC